jgi:hypothetical protein
MAGYGICKAARGGRPNPIDPGENMKSKTLRFAAAALLCALGLAACGGGSGSLLLGGSVIGLTKPGLVLINNDGGETVAVPANSVSFAFPTLLKSDTAFNVTVQTQPTAAHCEPTFNKGKTGAYNVTSIIVTCVTNSYNLGGTVEGLHAPGLVINNGSAQVEIASGATSFTFTKFKADGTVDSGKVADGAPYGVTVFLQPAGQTCTVTGGTGTMGSADTNTVAIKCV